MGNPGAPGRCGKGAAAGVTKQIEHVEIRLTVGRYPFPVFPLLGKDADMAEIGEFYLETKGAQLHQPGFGQGPMKVPMAATCP